MPQPRQLTRSVKTDSAGAGQQRPHLTQKIVSTYLRWQELSIPERTKSRHSDIFCVLVLLLDYDDDDIVRASPRLFAKKHERDTVQG